MKKIVAVMMAAGSLALLAGAAQADPEERRVELKQYQVRVHDDKGHREVIEVCAMNEDNARTKAVRKFGHEGHHPQAGKTILVGKCRD